MAESREEIQARWWRDWWAQDFSWAGLAAKPVGQNGDTIHGGLHGERTLQEYWRRDPLSGATRDDAALLLAGELVRAPDGARWHAAHVPLVWLDGTPAKAGWDAAARAWLSGLVAARLAVATETPVEHICEAMEPDGRAQLAGLVLLHALPIGGDQAIPPMIADWAWLPGWDAAHRRIGGGFRCLSAHFFETTNFDSTMFSGDASFNGATFSDDAIFTSAFFSSIASLNGVTFLATAIFNGARFLGGASFRYAGFRSFAGFDQASFAGDARFESARFLSTSSFDQTAFSREARFDHVTFSIDVRFVQTNFLGDARFDHANFLSFTRFRGATFSGNANFFAATFLGSALFDGAAFSRHAGFQRASFERRISFARARFDGLAVFTALRAWPAQLVDLHGAFTHAAFARTLDLEGSGLRSLAAFDGIRIGPDASLRLDDLPEVEFKAVFQDELGSALAADPREFGGPNAQSRAQPRSWWYWPRIVFARMFPSVCGPLAKPDTVRQTRSGLQDNRLKKLERGCRALVVEMEKLRDRNRAQLFYRFEIEARRRQHETPRWEKIVSWLYDKLGDYGASIARPLFALLVSIPLLAPLNGGFLAWQLPAVCHGRLACACKHLREDPRGTLLPLVWGSLAFSASRTLPFGAWEVKAEDPAQNNPVRMLLVGEADTWQHVAIRALATLQSVFALAMAFLSGVAVRRRFQLD